MLEYGRQGASQHYAPTVPYLISTEAAQPTMNCNCPVLMLQKHELTFRVFEFLSKTLPGFREHELRM